MATEDAAFDALERQIDYKLATLEERLRDIYEKALRKALKNQKDFLRVMSRMGELEKRLPKSYTPAQVEKWRQGFLREQLRLADVVNSVARDLAAVGGEVADEIRAVMNEVYSMSRAATIKLAGRDAAVNLSFTLYDKRQIDILLRAAQSPFSKIAYRNLGADTAIRRRLQSELGQSIVLGESRTDAIKRIRAVTGQSVSQARRVAQTERVRVSSQARFEAMNEAAKMGVNLEKKWIARMVNTRDAHEFLNGKVIPLDEAFIVPPSRDVLYKGKKGAKTGSGYTIRFPGDPDAPARAVINCHCVLHPVVGKPGETLGKQFTSERENGIIDTSPRDKATNTHYPDVDDPFTGLPLRYVNEKMPVYPPDHIMAGMGCKSGREIDDIERLLHDYPGTDAKKWMKDKARYSVYDEFDEIRDVEIHWYYHPNTGKVEYKVKMKRGYIYIDEWRN